MPSSVTPLCHFYSFRWFIHSEEDIRNLYTFRPEVLDRANALLTNANLSRVNAAAVDTLVGIHVRRGDRGHAFKLAPQEYFIKAMHYFRQKYHNVHFIVASEDHKWVRENLGQFRNVSLLPAGSSAATDMAVMTLCDHVIMTLGSYGFWSAFLAQGEVIYYNGHDHYEYFPKHWIAMV